MGLKEFFKITKRKIISLMILLGLSGILYSSAGFEQTFTLVDFLAWIFILPPVNFLIFTRLNDLLIPINENGLGNWIMFIVGVIFVVIYQYLLICFISWIIGKVKSKTR